MPQDGGTITGTARVLPCGAVIMRLIWRMDNAAMFIRGWREELRLVDTVEGGCPARIFCGDREISAGVCEAGMRGSESLGLRVKDVVPGVAGAPGHPHGGDLHSRGAGDAGEITSPLDDL
jgi:hypothetical protein